MKSQNFVVAGLVSFVIVTCVTVTASADSEHWRSVSISIRCTPEGTGPLCAVGTFSIYPDGSFYNHKQNTRGSMSRWQFRPVAEAAEALAGEDLKNAPVKVSKRAATPGLMREETEIVLNDGSVVVVETQEGATGEIVLRGDESAVAALRRSIVNIISAGTGPRPH